MNTLKLDRNAGPGPGPAPTTWPEWIVAPYDVVHHDRVLRDHERPLVGALAAWREAHPNTGDVVLQVAVTRRKPPRVVKVIEPSDDEQLCQLAVDLLGGYLDTEEQLPDNVSLEIVRIVQVRVV